MSLKDYHWTALATCDRNVTRAQAAARYAAYLTAVREASLEAGGKGDPPTNSLEPDENEQLIREQWWTGAPFLQEQTEEAIRCSEEKLSDFRDSVDSVELQACVQVAEAERNQHRDTFHAAFEFARDSLRKRQGALNLFRERHGLLDRDPRETKEVSQAVTTMLLMLLFEAGLGAYIFALGNPYGLFGGYIDALIFAGANCAGAFVGMVGINVLGLRPRKLWLGLGVVFLVLYDVYVVLVRAAALESVDTRLFSYGPFHFDRFSLVLFLMGIVLGIWSGYEGNQLHDPVRGYAEQAKRLTEAKQRLIDLREEECAARLSLQESAVERVKQVITRYRLTLRNYRNEASHLNALYLQLTGEVTQLQGRVVEAIKIYRKVNCDTRGILTNPPPAYFHENLEKEFDTDTLLNRYAYINCSDAFEELHRKVEMLCAERERIEERICALFAEPVSIPDSAPRSASVRTGISDHIAQNGTSPTLHTTYKEHEHVTTNA
jgi:hypothetical protein